MQELLRGSRTRVIGPNTLGIMNPFTGLNATPGLHQPIGGTVAFLSESASLGRLVLDWSFKQIVGFSVFASLGTMLDVSWANLIDYFGSDPSTRTIVIQISNVGDAQSFLSAAREVALNKPIIVIKAGRSASSQRALAWNSYGVPTSHDVLSAAFDRVGVLQVDALEDLFYTADALSKQPRPAGPRLMVVSNTIGPGLLAADSVAASGVELAQPSEETSLQLDRLLPQGEGLGDVRGDGTTNSLVEAVRVAANDSNCDGLLLLMVPSALANPQATAESLIELRHPDKPLLISYSGTAEGAAAQETLARACIPTLSSPEAAARVFRYMWRYSYDLQALYETPTLHGDGDYSGREFVRQLIEKARDARQPTLTADQVGEVLAHYGIPQHDHAPASLAGGRHAKLGSRIDPHFGPVLIFGSADRGPAVYGDLAIGLPPLNATLARRMLEQSRFYEALLRQFDSERLPALEEVLVRFSRLIAEQRWIKSFELDPLLISAEGALPAAGQCELHSLDVQTKDLPRPAIRPYPTQYVSAWKMKSGEEVTIRPIRAEDEPLMVRFHEELSDESVYLRYFQRVKLSTRTAHRRLSRICFLDYDREIALLAELRDHDTGHRRIVAVATLVKIPQKNDGEIAVLITDKFQRQGLGRELLRRLVEFARDEGLNRIVASTMLENQGMRTVFAKLGFELSIDEDEGLVNASIKLC